MRDRNPVLPIAGVTLCTLAALCGLVAGPAHAIESIGFEVAEIRTGFGSAEGVTLSFGVGEPARVTLRADTVVLPPPFGTISDVRLECLELHATGSRVDCARATAIASFAGLGTQTLQARFAYDTATRQLELHVEGLEVARAPIELDLSGTTDEWRARLSGRGLDAATLASLAAELAGTRALPALTGSLALTVSARGDRGGPTGIDARVAAESLAVDLVLGLRRSRSDAWEFDTTGTVTTGQLYVEPWFVDVADGPLALEAHGTLDPAVLRVTDASYRQPGVVSASAEARIAIGTQPHVESARVRVDEALFPAAYRIYLKPWLYGGMLDALATGGRAEAQFSLDGEGLESAAVSAHDLSIDDANGRFAVYGLDGGLRWNAKATAPDSRLAWQGGFIYGIGFGPAAAAVGVSARGFRLLEPLALPVLDGTLRIAELAVDNAPELTVGFDAELEPIDMRALTAALGWPSFAGRLSGRIPNLSYDQGVLTLGGDLRAEVFGGTITVENLQLSEPLGDLPRLAANARVRGLDLETLTDTFAVGRIEGRLDGDVDDLQLFRWTPVAFDANFRTPPDDDSRHRISQRAVESISSLGGGGAAAALSSGFLRFFETFAYARLGLGCRLEKGVCHMHGVAPAPHGYYIVQGKWLPRIDVIGYADRVDWPVLVGQLKSLAQVDEAVVQ